MYFQKVLQLIPSRNFRHQFLEIYNVFPLNYLIHQEFFHIFLMIEYRRCHFH